VGPYYRYISLGHACQPAYHIRNILGQQEAHFFDWLVTSPTTIITLLQSGGPMSLFNDKSAFKITGQHKNNAIVEHNQLGVIFYHDFPYIGGITAWDKVVSKYTHLAKRWQDTMNMGQRILFIRHHANKEEALALKSAIYHAHPKLQYDIMIVNETSQPTTPWNIDNIIDMTLNTAGNDWRGDIAGWTRIFNKLKLT
jgi:hypothetical protein